MQQRRNTAGLVIVTILLVVVHVNVGHGSPRQEAPLVSDKKTSGAFTLSDGGSSAPLWVSASDFPGVLRAAKDLRDDIGRVTSARPDLSVDAMPAGKEIVLVGTLGKNTVIDKLIGEKKLNVDEIRGKWETYLLHVVERPLPGVDRALVIVGSDKRGTIFGIYTLSAAIGVSPWYWWADVPPRRQSRLFVLPGRHSDGEPAVKYRGIFINDEVPALSGWAFEKFGGFNHRFYSNVFELILRLKGNFLWPAMWGRAFYDDDSLNAPLAEEYGVVIGTSHHEPMMRAHDEWRRYGRGGAWNYEKNDSALREFWREGIRRMRSYESIVTLAMRGDGDEPMSDEANVSLLERIVRDQRQILAEVTGKDVTTIPQVWALYKEVQEYYDKGMRVPDDVTLLLCDDNWGNLRKLPTLTEQPRAGGYGIYYHFDYVGAPRNYKWLNTNQIARVWEQMHLAYEYGARQIWIVNVGDIKPMEFPMSFFLDYAWNPRRWRAEDLPEYARQWAEQQFGPRSASEIAHILFAYTKYNARRKPELLAPETYSLTNYREAETVVAEYNSLVNKAQRISNELPHEHRDAFYQLVLHPVLACANLNELYVTVGRNHLYARQGRRLTNQLAERARELFRKDSAITHYYNNVLAGGKWSHMMDQTHIGYTSWQQPEMNIMPEVKEITIPERAEMGVAIEGSASWWPEERSDAVLPEFDSFGRQSYYIELFNRGSIPFRYEIQPSRPFVHVRAARGTIETELRVWVSVDWQKAPRGKYRVPIVVSGPNDTKVIVQALIHHPPADVAEKVAGFLENDGYVSMQAEHYSRAIRTDSISWCTIPDLGRTGSAVTTMPVTVSEQTPNASSPRLEFDLHLFTKGDVKVVAYFSPTLNFHNRPLRFGLSFDDQPPQVLDLWNRGAIHDWKYPPEWLEAVANNIRTVYSTHKIDQPGPHVLKYWMISPGVVLQKLVVIRREVKPSYLGPPESVRMIPRKGVRQE